MRNGEPNDNSLYNPGFQLLFGLSFGSPSRPFRCSSFTPGTGPPKGLITCLFVHFIRSLRLNVSEREGTGVDDHKGNKYKGNINKWKGK